MKSSECLNQIHRILRNLTLHAKKEDRPLSSVCDNTFISKDLKSHQKMEDTEASSIRDLPLDNHRGQTRKCILSVVLVLLALILAAVISAVVMKANEEDLDQPKQKTLVIKIPQSK